MFASWEAILSTPRAAPCTIVVSVRFGSTRSRETIASLTTRGSSQSLDPVTITRMSVVLRRQNPRLAELVKDRLDSFADGDQQDEHHESGEHRPVKGLGRN